MLVFIGCFALDLVMVSNFRRLFIWPDSPLRRFNLPDLTARASHIDEGIRIDVPADGRVSFENKYGTVDSEIWD